MELRRILEEKGYKVVEIVEKTPLTDITRLNISKESKNK